MKPRLRLQRMPLTRENMARPCMGCVFASDKNGTTKGCTERMELCNVTNGTQDLRIFTEVAPSTS